MTKTYELHKSDGTTETFDAWDAAHKAYLALGNDSLHTAYLKLDVPPKPPEKISFIKIVRTLDARGRRPALQAVLNALGAAIERFRRA